MKRYILHIIFLLALILGSANPAFSQADPRFAIYPHNHLDWFTLESQHFKIHFQEGNSRTAKVVSRIAEDIYPHITGLYKHEPDEKVSIILKDREDYANGAAYFFDNKIDIWVPALDTPLRGTNNWLRNVITHEFTHIIQIQVGMKRKRTVPAWYIQWLSYEDVRRPDVLFGFPNGIATYPLLSLNIPAWLAEGTAQYQVDGLNYDTWDSHRDMILRTRALSGKVLSLDVMGTFTNKSSLERETVYNHGYAFTRYVAKQYGDSTLRKLTETLAQDGVYDVAKAFEKTVGVDGKELHRQWVQDITKEYESQLKNVDPITYPKIEEEGFFNFYPVFGKNDSTLFYLSNAGRDFSRLRLVKKENGEIEPISQIFNLEAAHDDHVWCFSKEKKMPDRVAGVFSFSPDYEKLAYSRPRLNKFGEYYQDIYTYDLLKGDHDRLTRNRRLSSPAWHPGDPSKIAAIQSSDGTLNLVLLDAESSEITQLTDYSKGEQVYTPRWSEDGYAIYFASSTQFGRSILRYTLSSKSVDTVLSRQDVDYRDPFLAGGYLYFSSDMGGIFNIYRSPVQEPSQMERLTSVSGGAFMPAVDGSGKLVFSEYVWDGYKISSLAPSKPKALAPFTYSHPGVLAKSAGLAMDLNTFDDTDLSPEKADQLNVLSDTVFVPVVRNGDTADERSLYRYKDTFTKFAFFPIVRFDNYSKLNGNNLDLLKAARMGELGQNLWRDVKPGVFFSSREIRERFNIYGGALFGIGSYESTDGLRTFAQPDRISKLDRDLFLILEYVGLPFIKRHWSPTVSVELYNLRRNVRDGLLIEDFECTSCLPDTTTTDLAYEIWQADVFFRSKINNFSILELGYSYSPFTVKTDPFFLQEFGQVIPSSTSRYFKASTFSAGLVTRLDVPDRDDDVVPFGIRSSLFYRYQPAQLLTSYEIKNGLLLPVYDLEQNHSLEANIRYTTETPLLPVGVRGRFFTYLNNPTNFFYMDYIGGFIGMRSYPFFALGGVTTAFMEGSWFFPIFPNIEKQLGRFTLHKVWGKLYAEAGNGWGGPLNISRNLKTGVGGELRFSMSSYYLFPSRFFINASYGLTEFDLDLPPEFISAGGDAQTRYGRDLLLYFGFLFEFDL